MKRSEAKARLEKLNATKRMGKSEVGTSEGGVNTSAKADRLTKTVQNAKVTQPESPAPPKAKRPGLASGAQIADTTTKRLAKQSRPDKKMSMPDVRARTGPIRDYQAAKSDAAKRSAGMGLYPGGIKRRVGGPTRGSEARANDTKTVGQNAQKERDATVAHNKYAYKSGTQAALSQQKAASQSQAYKRTADANKSYNQVTQAAKKPDARSSQTRSVAADALAKSSRAAEANRQQTATNRILSTPSVGRQNQPIVTPTGATPSATTAAAIAAKASASKAALPTSVVKTAAKTGGQTVNKGTSKAPIANPRMKSMQQQRVGNWKNAETVGSYRKRMSMKEERIWDLIEANETEPIKAKVVDKVKKEKNKKVTDMGGPTDIVDTEPQKAVQMGQQSR